MVTVSEERFLALEKEVKDFREDVHKQDLVTVDTLARVETLLKGVTTGLSRKGAIGYGGGTAGIIVVVIEIIKLIKGG